MGTLPDYLDWMKSSPSSTTKKQTSTENKTGVVPLSERPPMQPIVTGVTYPTTVQKTEYPGERPTMPEMPEYSPPDVPTMPEFTLPDMPKEVEFERPEMGDMPTFKAPDRPDIPDFEAPKMGELPEFAAPEWNEAEINKKTQQAADPDIRRLRDAMQQAMAQRYDNPNVKRMSLREALQGYGIGLGGVMKSARSQATSEYSQKYAREYDAAARNFSTRVQKIRDEYQGQLTADITQYNALAAAQSEEYQTAVREAQNIYDTEVQTVRDQYQADWNEASAKYTTRNANQQKKFDADMRSAEINWRENVQHIRDQYLSELDKTRIEYEAERERRMTDYNNLWSEYLGSGTVTRSQEFPEADSSYKGPKTNFGVRPFAV